MKWCGRLPQTGEAVEIWAEDGKISSIRRLAAEANGQLPWLSAGWIDLQVNGFGGYDLNGEETTAEDIAGVTRSLHAHGVTSYLPTVITGSFARMSQGLSAIAKCCAESALVRSSILGIHLEGPYLSSERGSRGAHPKEYTRDPDWNEFQRLQETAGGLIRMVTVAPERQGAVAFIEQLVKAGIVVAIGHTKATAEELDAAVRAGATLSTHLGNGAEPVLPRLSNYIWNQLADDRLWASLIPDGHHLPPAVLKVMTRAKGHKSVFVSDGTKFGGMQPGRYPSLIGGEVVLTESGLLHTAEDPNILAGSALSLATGIVNAIKYTDMHLKDAIDAITARPAMIMGESRLGTLKVGNPANITLFSYNDKLQGELTVVETVVAGVSVFKHGVEAV